MTSKMFQGFLLGILFFGCAGSALNIAVFRGNAEKARLQRNVTINGKEMLEVIYPKDAVFSDMQCVHKYDLQKLQQQYNKCVKAGVKFD